MKKYCIGLMLVFICGLSACSENAPTKVEVESTATIKTQESSVAVSVFSGTILAETQLGTDGSVWNFQTDDGEMYSVVVSIPNLGRVESENIKYVVDGARLRITGESYKLGDENHLLARKIHVLN